MYFSQIPPISNSIVLLSDLNGINTYTRGQTGGDKYVEKQKLPKRFEYLGVPVGFLSTNRKNRPQKQRPNTEIYDNDPVLTDKLMNYFIDKALP